MGYGHAVDLGQREDEDPVAEGIGSITGIDHIEFFELKVFKGDIHGSGTLGGVAAFDLETDIPCG